MKATILWIAIIPMISTVSSIFWGKTGGYPYGTQVSNVRPDYAVPYNNYGYGYGYQGISSIQAYNRPYYSFGIPGSSSSYSYPNTGSFGFPFFGQSSQTNPYGSTYGYNYNYQNPYYGRPYSFFPTGTSYKA